MKNYERTTGTQQRREKRERNKYLHVSVQLRPVMDELTKRITLMEVRPGKTYRRKLEI